MTTEASNIMHPIHEHELALCDKEEDNEGDCGVCKQNIAGQHYHCTKDDCSSWYYIHKYPCSQIPEFIQRHPFHPRHNTLFLLRLGEGNQGICGACGTQVFITAYSCSQCSLSLHIKCALLRPRSTKNSENDEQEPEQEQTPNHPHPLILCDKWDKSSTYTCSCCGMDFDGGNCSVFVCLECKALLHKSCAELPFNLEHPFHPAHPLSLISQNPLDSNTCEVCSVAIEEVFMYHCSDCQFSIDIHCASLKLSEEYVCNDRLTHPHPLILCDKKTNFPIPCHACALPLRDSILFCSECHVLLHKSCAELPLEIKHQLHPEHALTICYHDTYSRFSEDWRCEVCAGSCNGIFFECTQCKWHMDVRCALSMPTTMMSKVHIHPLALFKEPNPRLVCDVCDQHCLTPYFRCVPCDYNLHIHCISTLPPTLKARHWHPLTLTDSPIKDYPDEGDDAEFYCDACEERRELFQRSYYCEDCHYVAQPHCVLSEIMHNLEEEWLDQERHEGVEKVQDPPSLTLKEFLDSFNEDENKEVQGILEANSEDSILHLNATWSTQILKLPWEIWSSTSKLITVNNYMVLENSAPSLKVLFEKYGNFVGESGLSPKVKMLHVMTLCDAVHTMCNTKAMDMTTDLLVTWFHSFRLCQRAGFNTHFVDRRLERLMCIHFDILRANVSDEKPEELAITERRGRATINLVKNLRSVRDAFTRLEGEIKQLEKKLEDKRALLKMWMDYCYDAVELRGQMAGTGLL